jgi:hypothetical protein
MSDGHVGKTHGEFSTAQFFHDGTSEYVRRFVGAEEAVDAASHYVQCPAALMGITVKVVVTDGGDNTVFSWERDKGITWPTEAKAFGQYKYD